mmetsp:Transcript_17120/g.56005  ORF Transcript_17120/g.56005 Transcript_17120/m.56005 type:complete len:387 (+) Transcript_17120:29-1189(+)
MKKYDMTNDLLAACVSSDGDGFGCEAAEASAGAPVPAARARLLFLFGRGDHAIDVGVHHLELFVELLELHPKLVGVGADVRGAVLLRRVRVPVRGVRGRLRRFLRHRRRPNRRLLRRRRGCRTLRPRPLALLDVLVHLALVCGDGAVARAHHARGVRAAHKLRHVLEVDALLELVARLPPLHAREDVDLLHRVLVDEWFDDAPDGGEGHRRVDYEHLVDALGVVGAVLAREGREGGEDHFGKVPHREPAEVEDGGAALHRAPRLGREARVHHVHEVLHALEVVVQNLILPHARRGQPRHVNLTRPLHVQRVSAPVLPVIPLRPLPSDDGHLLLRKRLVQNNIHFLVSAPLQRVCNHLQRVRHLQLARPKEPPKHQPHVSPDTEPRR